MKLRELFSSDHELIDEECNKSYDLFSFFILMRYRISRPITTNPKKIPMAIAIGMAIMMLTWNRKIERGMMAIINNTVISPMKKSMSMTISWRNSIRVLQCFI